MSTALFACLALLGAQPGPSQQSETVPSLPIEQEFRLDPNEAHVPANLDAEGSAAIDGLNRFGLELYGKLRSGNGDLAVSPASVSTAFALAYGGARGETAREIASTLHYPAVGNFHRSFGELLKAMEVHRNGRTLTVNSAIWLQIGMAVNADYVSMVDRYYGAGLQRVDFRADSEAARTKINDWVESKTNNRIRNLLQPAQITADTRSVLVNTIYFKSDWNSPFEKADTRDENFTLATGDKVKRKLMHKLAAFAYAEGAALKVVAMPYRGSETEMVIFLPDKADGLSALERSLDATSINQWIDKLNEGGRPQVKITFPKYRIESRFDLVEPLVELGMRVPFSNQSDFSAMKAVSPASPDREDWNLKISNVVHQVFVEVEEKGTEAAAATAIAEMIVTGTRRSLVPPKEFRADHPFLFLIRDRRTKAILFVGRYTGETSN